MGNTVSRWRQAVLSVLPNWQWPSYLQISLPFKRAKKTDNVRNTKSPSEIRTTHAKLNKPDDDGSSVDPYTNQNCEYGVTGVNDPISGSASVGSTVESNIASFCVESEKVASRSRDEYCDPTFTGASSKSVKEAVDIKDETKPKLTLEDFPIIRETETIGKKEDTEPTEPVKETSDTKQTTKPITTLEGSPKDPENKTSDTKKETKPKPLLVGSSKDGTQKQSELPGFSKDQYTDTPDMKEETKQNSNVSSKNLQNSDTKEETRPNTENVLSASADSVAIKKKDGFRLEENLKFYRNEITSKPFPGSYIEDMLEWRGDYKKLEYGHAYIQWLFPIPESSGLNYSAQELFPYEAEEIRNGDETHARVLRAYKMMLDFYGMELLDERTGEIRRCEANWEERFEHLNRSFHNYLRITRILKSLGELGFDRYQKPLVKFIITEAVVNKTLPNLNADSMNYWVTAIKDQNEVAEMYKLWQDTCENPQNYDEHGNPISNENGKESDQKPTTDVQEVDNDLSATTEDSGCSADVMTSKAAGFLTEKANTLPSEQSLHIAKTKADESVTSEMNREEENLKFYRNEIASKPPPGNTIEEILKWKGDYHKLEKSRSEIQWLFPTPEQSSSNTSIQKLFPHEAEAIRDDTVMHVRVLRAYTMMLDFYGMELVDETSGEIRRCEANWKERSTHLNTSYFNHMRITRILISLAQLGYDRFQVPLVRFIMAEAIVTKQLPNLDSNNMDYWINAIKDEDEKIAMMKLRQNMRIHPQNFYQYGNPVIPDQQNENQTYVSAEGDDVHATADQGAALALECTSTLEYAEEGNGALTENSAFQPVQEQSVPHAEVQEADTTTHDTDERTSESVNEKDNILDKTSEVQPMKGKSVILQQGEETDIKPDNTAGTKTEQAYDKDNASAEHSEVKSSKKTNEPSSDVATVETKQNEINECVVEFVDAKNDVLIDAEVLAPKENSDSSTKANQTNCNDQIDTASKDAAVFQKQNCNKEKDSPRLEENLKFYRNEIVSGPGRTIEEMLKLKEKYDTLHANNIYIRWLFPVSQPTGKTGKLLPHEAEAIRNDEVMHDRVLRAYEMMLDFYGMELVDETSGVIRRREANWEKRYEFWHGVRPRLIPHCRQITRILTSLGELGYERFQGPLVEFLMTEALINKTLHSVTTETVEDWIRAVQDPAAVIDLYTNIREHPEQFSQQAARK